MIRDRLPTLNAARVRLRGLEERDVGALFAVFSNPAVTRYWSRPAMTQLAEAHDLLADVRAGFDSGDLFQWGVERRRDDGVIGTCTLFHIDTKNRRAEVGYALAREHWGQGYMSEALHALIRYAFEDLDLQRLEADVDPRNDGSVRSLERHGFVREGHLRERWFVNGEVQDSLMFGLLRREWRAAGFSR